jgi:hypothetical protein
MEVHSSGLSVHSLSTFRSPSPSHKHNDIRDDSKLGIFNLPVLRKMLMRRTSPITKPGNIAIHGQTRALPSTHVFSMSFEQLSALLRSLGFVRPDSTHALKSF